MATRILSTGPHPLLNRPLRKYIARHKLPPLWIYIDLDKLIPVRVLTSLSRSEAQDMRYPIELSVGGLILEELQPGAGYDLLQERWHQLNMYKPESKYHSLYHACRMAEASGWSRFDRGSIMNMQDPSTDRSNRFIRSVWPTTATDYAQVVLPSAFITNNDISAAAQYLPGSVLEALVTRRNDNERRDIYRAMPGLKDVLEENPIPGSAKRYIYQREGDIASLIYTETESSLLSRAIKTHTPTDPFDNGIRRRLEAVRDYFGSSGRAATVHLHGSVLPDNLVSLHQIVRLCY